MCRRSWQWALYCSRGTKEVGNVTSVCAKVTTWSAAAMTGDMRSGAGHNFMWTVHDYWSYYYLWNILRKTIVFTMYVNAYTDDIKYPCMYLFMHAYIYIFNVRKHWNETINKHVGDTTNKHVGYTTNKHVGYTTNKHLGDTTNKQSHVETVGDGRKLSKQWEGRPCMSA